MANGGVHPQDNAVPDTTPKLHDSSLQQGDVAMLQEGQQVMKKMQKPATPAPQTQAPPQDDMQFQVPEPVSFISGKAAGSLERDGLPGERRAPDNEKWLPFLQKIATAPGSGGTLQAAYVEMLGKLNIASSQGAAVLLDQREFDASVEQVVNDNTR